MMDILNNSRGGCLCQPDEEPDLSYSTVDMKISFRIRIYICKVKNSSTFSFIFANITYQGRLFSRLNSFLTLYYFDMDMKKKHAPIYFSLGPSCGSEQYRDRCWRFGCDWRENYC